MHAGPLSVLVKQNLTETTQIMKTVELSDR